MRVLCIDNSQPKRPDMLLPQDWIQEGEVYTVIGGYTCEDDGHYYYYLRERMRRDPPAYRANRFIPLTGEGDVTEEERRHTRVGKKRC